MGTIATVIAALVLAGAATAGVVVTQSGGPDGSAPKQEIELTAVYDSGR